MEREGEGEGRREEKRRGEGEREMRKEGRGRRGWEMRKGIIVTLFLIINILMISCGNAGPVPQEGQAATSDGTIIDLAKVSKKIKETLAFVTKVKKVVTLVKSVDELAKAIDQKVDNSSHKLADGAGEKNHNGSLVAGAFQIISTAKVSLIALEKESGISEALMKKIGEAKAKSDEFLNKLDESKEKTNAEKAIDITKDDGSKGGNELKALNQLVDNLLEIVNAELESAIDKLTIFHTSKTEAIKS